ncbi:MAG TPA: thioredoxin domain-containing protein [Desulfosalsimonadaceae bacterium]|nr:thioredoxin domain-containing protein [Desulfosalsimonadaceae bacterium]
MTEDQGHTHYNRLIDEKSPYLIQHAHQPVDWHAWGEKAFEQAHREDKPVLVSIGYSTCHWCHVMAEESFDDPQIAELMNKHFVCIKVDREERPDIDSLYITAVSSLTGSAGWPLNVFLTPDGKPFFGGTYFPPQSRRVMPGWPDVLNQVYKAWTDPEQRKKIEASADSITKNLKQHLSDPPSQVSQSNISMDLIKDTLKGFAEDFDSKNGGFSNAPKFPMPPILQFLLTYYRFSEETEQDDALKEKSLAMLNSSLDAMAFGGIYDHLGGGFHRYSTDAKWHVPHFEKMLYDNGQLISVYTRAYQMTGNRLYAGIVKESIDYVLRDMTHPDGGFYSAEDADSVPPNAQDANPAKREGAFYAWPYQEIRTILEQQVNQQAAELFCYLFDVRDNGNVSQDPFGEFKGQNVLHQIHSIKEGADRFGMAEAEARHLLAKAKRRLFDARLNRPRPHLDDKILTAWNGLMISALAQAATVFDEPEYMSAAEKAVKFIHSHMYAPDANRLYRRWREGEAKIDALADDYAFLINGLIDLYEASFQPWLLEWAVRLMHRFLSDFIDQSAGLVYLTPQSYDPYLSFQMKDAIDNVTPSAASGAALGLVRLSRITGSKAFDTASASIFRYAAGQMVRFSKMAPYLLMAAMVSMTKHIHMVIAGSKNSPDTNRLIEAGRRAGGLGQSMVVVSDDSDRDGLARILPNTAEIRLPDTGAAAQVCFNQTCRPPVHSPEKFVEQLETAFE